MERKFKAGDMIYTKTTGIPYIVEGVYDWNYRICSPMRTGAMYISCGVVEEECRLAPEDTVSRILAKYSNDNPISDSKGKGL